MKHIDVWNKVAVSREYRLALANVKKAKTNDQRRQANIAVNYWRQKLSVAK